MIGVLVFLFVVYVGLEILGPRLPYRFRQSIVIDCSPELIWNKLFVETAYGTEFSADVLERRWDSAVDNLLWVNKRLKNGDSLLTGELVLAEQYPCFRATHLTCVARNGTAALSEPFGEDSSETIVLEPVGPDRTRVVVDERFQSRCVYDGLVGVRMRTLRWLRDRKALCEEKQAKSSRAKLILSLIVTLVGIATSLKFFGPILTIGYGAVIALHELGHALAYWIAGERVLGFALIPVFGGCVVGTEPKSVYKKAMISFGGVSFSLILTIPLLLYVASGTLVINDFNYGPVVDRWKFIALEAGFVLLVINALQLLPAPLLDGGHIVKLAVSELRLAHWNVGIYIVIILTAAVAYALGDLIFGVGIIGLSLLSLKGGQNDRGIGNSRNWRPPIVIGVAYLAHVALYAACIGFVLHLQGQLPHGQFKVSDTEYTQPRQERQNNVDFQGLSLAEVSSTDNT